MGFNLIRIAYKIVLILGIVWAIGTGLGYGAAQNSPPLAVFGFLVVYPCGWYIYYGGRN